MNTTVQMFFIGQSSAYALLAIVLEFRNPNPPYRRAALSSQQARARTGGPLGFLAILGGRRRDSLRTRRRADGRRSARPVYRHVGLQALRTSLRVDASRNCASDSPRKWRLDDSRCAIDLVPLNCTHVEDDGVRHRHRRKEVAQTSRVFMREPACVLWPSMP
jgi:hypothetical protein